MPYLIFHLCELAGFAALLAGFAALMSELYIVLLC